MFDLEDFSKRLFIASVRDPEQAEMMKYKNGKYLTDEQREHFEGLKRLGQRNESYEYLCKCEEENRTPEYHEYLNKRPPSYMDFSIKK